MGRLIIGLVGAGMIVLGVLHALGRVVHESGDHVHHGRLIVLAGTALALYGNDLVLRALRPQRSRRPGALQLVCSVLFASLLLGAGVFGMVRGDLAAGAFSIATGFAGLLLVLLVRAR